MKSLSDLFRPKRAVIPDCPVFAPQHKPSGPKTTLWIAIDEQTGKPLGYGVLTGEPLSEELLESYRALLSSWERNGGMLVLASDNVVRVEFITPHQLACSHQHKSDLSSPEMAALRIAWFERAMSVR